LVYFFRERKWWKEEEGWSAMTLAGEGEDKEEGKAYRRSQILGFLKKPMNILEKW